MRAVQFDDYGDIEVLEVRDVPTPTPAAGQVLVRVRAAGINPGEAMIRKGALAEQWPSTFPSGQGSDLAGTVEQVGANVTGFAVGDEVFGWTDERASQAEYAVVPAGQLFARPDTVSREQAGGLHVAGATAWAATRAVNPQPGETVVVSGAAGGVGSLVVQLVAERGASVIGLAGPANHDWLRAHGVTPIEYGDGVEERIGQATPNGVDAFIDTFGQGYVDLALRLGVAPGRIDTVADFAALAEDKGILGEGNAQGANRADLTQVVERIADGRLELEIAATYPLEQVRAAFTELERRHTRGKIVLLPSGRD